MIVTGSAPTAAETLLSSNMHRRCVRIRGGRLLTDRSGWEGARSALFSAGEAKAKLFQFPFPFSNERI